MAKPKYGSKLDTESDLRLQPSPILPDFKLLYSSKQPQPSKRAINTK